MVKVRRKTAKGRKVKYGMAIAAVIAAVIIAALFCLFPGRSALRSYMWQRQYDLGQKYLAELDYEQAVVAFSGAIEIEPRNAEAYDGRAEALTGLAGTMEVYSAEWIGTIEEAVQDYTAVLDIYGEETGRSASIRERAGIYLSRARLYTDMSGAYGDGSAESTEYISKAADDLEEATSVYPSSKSHYLLLADLYEKAGDSEKLEETIKLGLEQASDTEELEKKEAELAEKGLMQPDDYTVRESFYNPDGTLVGTAAIRYENGKEVWIELYSPAMELEGHEDFVYDDAGISVSFPKVTKYLYRDETLRELYFSRYEVSSYTLDQEGNITENVYRTRGRDGSLSGEKRETNTYENGKETSVTSYYDDLTTPQKTAVNELDAKGRMILQTIEYFREDGSLDYSVETTYEWDESAYTRTAVYKYDETHSYTAEIDYYSEGWENLLKEERYNEYGRAGYYIIYDYEVDTTADSVE